ncbi:type II toxin-antitoxin system HicB family antitoxin [Desulfovermiculus halophilus]|jgi:antitoxin HicB|uniref:type II toxin-antitoxin system HicB family antitoxin n=1 Tax=Desulfovermiculus halophilus TaxID=339722 RepID=UPI000688B2A8|nr:type II toxin-antitoxin system HicB family antitoxin [Desulfovermiculus halophilus]
MFHYPVEITHLDNGDVMVWFTDIPEAMTYGDNEEFALEWAQDALHVALSGYMDEHRDIPSPSIAKPGQNTVSPAPIVGVKLCLYQEIRDRGISQLKLAKLLHCDARQIRRLLDLDHQSTVSQLMDAAEVLGFELDIELTRRQGGNHPGVN